MYYTFCIIYWSSKISYMFLLRHIHSKLLVLYFIRKFLFLRDILNNLLWQNQSMNDLKHCLNCIWNAAYILKLALYHCPFAWVLSLKILVSRQHFCIGFHATIRALIWDSKNICLAHIPRNSKEIDGRSVCLIKRLQHD